MHVMQQKNQHKGFLKAKGNAHHSTGFAGSELNLNLTLKCAQQSSSTIYFNVVLQEFLLFVVIETKAFPSWIVKLSQLKTTYEGMIYVKYTKKRATIIK